MAGSARHRGCATKPVSRRPVVAAVLLVTNHGGQGEIDLSPWRTERGDGRNGPVTTVPPTSGVRLDWVRADVEALRRSIPAARRRVSDPNP